MKNQPATLTDPLEHGWRPGALGQFGFSQPHKIEVAHSSRWIFAKGGSCFDLPATQAIWAIWDRRDVFNIFLPWLLWLARLPLSLGRQETFRLSPGSSVSQQEASLLGL